MGFSDPMMEGCVPVCPRELGKKKRTNRLAKLKQKKIDARREQWLSQAKNKGFKDEFGVGNGNNDSVPVSLPPKGARDSRNLEMKSKRDENVVEFMMDCGGVDSVLGGNDTRKERPGSSSGSCNSSSGCFSGTISEEEEEEEEERVEDDDDDGCLDDWETMADALIADEKEKAPKSDPLAAKEISAELAKPECNSTVLAKPHAWRPNDAYRPQSLPNITKQLSLPMNSGRHCRRGGVNWPCRIITSQPSSCPICYEDLDLTDSSFLPCSCGFHLCLFCHKRILEADARCPGCRKQYSDPLNKDIGVGGGAPFIRIARSCSMNTRS